MKRLNKHSREALMDYAKQQAELRKAYNKQEEKKEKKKAKKTDKMKETHLINRLAKHVATLQIDSDSNKSEVIQFYRKDIY